MAQLPRFSRNYGRSGAYENPATVVDTKTAQIWANVIDNIGKQTQARLASKRKAEAAVVKETQDKIAYSIKQRKENAKEVYKFLGVNGLNNPALIDYATEQIDTLTKIDMESYKATDPREANEFAKQYDAQYQSMLSMKGVLTSMKESDAMWKAGLGSESTVLGVGSPGGLSAYSDKDRQYIYGNMIRSGMGDGGTERFYKDEAGTMMVEYKGGVAGKEGFTVVAEDFFNYMPETVPDDKTDLTSRLQKSNVITKDLTISPTLREKQNGEDIVRSDIDRNTQSLVTFSPLNTSQIAASSATISKALATNRLMSVAAQNSYTQNVRPFLESRGITQEDGSEWPKELETGDGINGKSFYSDKSQGIYKQALTAYTENMFGLNKTNQVISTTKLTDSEFKRRLGIVDDKDKQTKIDISYIDELKIPIQSGPALESGQRPVDLEELELSLNNEGFRVTKSEEVGRRGVNKITITKSIGGADNQAVITEEMTPQDIKRQLELVETGKMPIRKEDEDFSLYKIQNQ
jgi:hypothetical protein